jgi:hypothetical protein
LWALVITICGGRPLIVELDGYAFAHAAPDAVYILVMHKGEEPGAEAGTPLPEILLRNRANEGVLDEIVGSGHVTGQRAGIAPQPRDLSLEKPTEITHHSGLWSWQSTSRMVRLSEGRRRNLDYSEAQFFQELLLCRSLRGIGDELHAGLAGSSRISVYDFQTQPLHASAVAPIEHASDIRFRIASETTYGRFGG